MTVPTRNTPVGVMAVIVLLIVLVGMVFAVAAGGWWLLTLIVLVPCGGSLVYGINESFRKIPRDAKGNRIQ